MLHAPQNMAADTAGALTAINEDLQNVPDIVAVVLGGSYARGLARPDSDIDIGLYYREKLPFSVDRVRSVAESICTPGTVPVVTQPYDWGPWVNGGAWIQTPVGKVDFLYRNLDQVERVIEEGRRGIWRHDYDQQPPYGFRSVVYFGETHFSVPLHDPEGEIARLKTAVARYPQLLKNRIVKDSLWNVEFSLRICHSFEDAADTCNATGCMTRVAHFLTHALFALNEEYFLSDKYAVLLLDQFEKRPREFTRRLAAVLSKPGGNPAELRKSSELLSELWLETVELTNGTYTPRFDLKAGLPQTR
jgi:hypothetical protein